MWSTKKRNNNILVLLTWRFLRASKKKLSWCLLRTQGSMEKSFSVPQTIFVCLVRLLARDVWCLHFPYKKVRCSVDGVIWYPRELWSPWEYFHLILPTDDVSAKCKTGCRSTCSVESDKGARDKSQSIWILNCVAMHLLNRSIRFPQVKPINSHRQMKGGAERW